MSSLNIFFMAGVLPAAYLIGSIPTGVLVTRLATGRDVRRLGSGNIGATNVRRVAGNRMGAVVLLGDMLKGFLPVLFVMRLAGGDPASSVYVALTALCAFLGHLFPVYLKGRGGKGVATAAGCFMPISPVAMAATVLVFVLVVWRRRLVSLGSLGAAGALPVLVWLQNRSIIYSALGVVVAVLIFFRHSANIRRLREGTEPRI
jgi:glycerol-3-phosphate acyltransferase PlsY